MKLQLKGKGHLFDRQQGWCWYVEDPGGRKGMGKIKIPRCWTFSKYGTSRWGKLETIRVEETMNTAHSRAGEPG